MTPARPAQGRQRIHLGVTALAWLNLYQNIKQIIQDAIAPEIQSLKGDIRALEGRIQSFETHIEGRFRGLETQVESRIQSLESQIGNRIQGFETQVETRFRGLETQVAALRTELRDFEERTEKRLDQMNRQWELAIEVRERLATVEAQLKHR